MADKANILIIDGTSENLQALGTHLSQAGFAVRLAVNEEEGFKILYKEKIDCILLNHHLSCSPGIEIVRKIRAEMSPELMPVIMLTGLENEEEILRGLEAGADDYLNKSNSVEIALTKIRAVLRTKELRDAVIQLNRATSQLKTISIKDSLTGLYNRGYLQESLEMEISRAKRCKYNICCLMIDIDDYKLVNDNYGHSFGDFVLKEFGAALRACFRESDVIARYGGDEFVVLTIDTDYSSVVAIAERFRKYIEKYEFNDQGVAAKITTSVGISSLLEDACLNKDKFFSFADSACYEAKAQGKNKSVCYRDLSGMAGTEKKRLLAAENKIYTIAEYSKKSYVDSIKNLISAWEDKNPLASERSVKSLKYVKMIIAGLSLAKEESDAIENAAAIRDLGKLLISETISPKKSSLNPQEEEMLRKHPLLTVNLLSKNKFMKSELPSVLYHHERYDGNGYPSGLEGKHIPLGARVIRVADAYVEILAGAGNRSKKEINKELSERAGKELDPDIVSVFLKALQK